MITNNNDYDGVSFLHNLILGICYNSGIWQKWFMLISWFFFSHTFFIVIYHLRTVSGNERRCVCKVVPHWPKTFPCVRRKNVLLIAVYFVIRHTDRSTDRGPTPSPDTLMAALIAVSLHRQTHWSRHWSRSHSITRYTDGGTDRGLTPSPDTLIAALIAVSLHRQTHWSRH